MRQWAPEDADSVKSMIVAYYKRDTPDITDGLVLMLAKRLHKETPWAGTPQGWDEITHRMRFDKIDRAYAMLSAARTLNEYLNGVTPVSQQGPSEEDLTHTLASAIDFATSTAPEGTAVAYIGPREDQIQLAKGVVDLLNEWDIHLRKEETNDS